MVLCAVIFVFIFALCLDFAIGLNNGLARTPPMGWMSWGYYMCGVDCVKNPEKCLDERLILSVADAFYNDGYQEAGYEYIIIDDCWSEHERDKNGQLVPDRKRFPRGMKFLADYIHDRGLKFGMYTNIGEDTCMRYPGSRGYFRRDAKMFAEWGVDYLKVDGCFVENQFLDTAYIKLGDALNKTGRPMVFACSWPYYKQFIYNSSADYKMVSKYCNVWRNYHDVSVQWPAVQNIIYHYASNVEEFKKFHGPGQWNDPDMLILGTNSLTENQARIHMAVYAMLSAPLIISCDMNHITPHEKKLLQNLDLVAIAQDVLGIMATPYTLKEKLTLWVKRHLPMKGNKYHSYSFALVNMASIELSAPFMPANFGLESPDGHSVMVTQYNVYLESVNNTQTDILQLLILSKALELSVDIFTGIFIKNVTFSDVLTLTVPPEDVVMYTLFPL